MQQNNHKKNKIVILSAINDLTGDQRLHKVSTSLQRIGFQPLLLGLKFKSSYKIQDRDYRVKRFTMFFSKGPLFYAEFNLKLFFYLLFAKSSILVANDLDTLLANYLAYMIKRLFAKNLSLIYDSHELFTELPELNGRANTRKIWLMIEKWILPKIKNAYTVCQPIADYYFKHYKIKMHVIRNMPTFEQIEPHTNIPNFQIPEDKKIILYQGALNIGRGIEQVIDIMEFTDNAVFIIAGTGTIEKSLRQKVNEKNLTDKVIFTGKLPFDIINQLTSKADIGLVLQDDISLSYHYVLPNRLFDFIKAGVPVIASDLPEIKKIV
jgi:glycosyltransferase involved in cell wall biosynthesis